MFILCHSVKWIPNIWELHMVGTKEYHHFVWPKWIGDLFKYYISRNNISCLEYATYTSHFLTTMNGSVNVFIYFFKHKADLLRSCGGILVRRPSPPESLRMFNLTEMVFLIFCSADYNHFHFQTALWFFQWFIFQGSDWLMFLHSYRSDSLELA